MTERTLPHEEREGKPGPPTGMLLADVPRTPILSRSDLRLLDRAFSAVERGAELSLPIAAAINDLAGLDRLGIATMSGSTDAPDIRALLADFEPWPLGMGANRLAYGDTPRVLSLRSPGAPLVAAYLAGGNSENGLDLVRRVVTAFIWRAEPIVRVVLAARAFGEGAFKPEQFEAVADFAAKVLGAPLDPKTLVGTFREGVSMLGLPWLDGDPFTDPRIPGKPPFSSYLAPENQAWMHCVMGLTQLFPPLPSIPKTSPPPGSPTPATICQGSIPASGLDIKLTSVGVGFGQQGDWGIALRGVAATIVSWTTSEINIHVSNLQPGCNRLEWTYASNWTPDDNGVGAACIESLRLPKLSMPSAVAALADASKFWTSPGQISVLGPRIQRFEASAGTAGMSAEPCTPVTIDWIIDQLPCGALSGSLVQARLLRDGVQIAPSGAATMLPLIGSFLDRRELTVTYRLEVSSTDALGNSCGTVTRDLQVVRGPKLIHFGLPAEVSPGNPQTVPILISCPAPAGGLTVTLSSNPAMRLNHPATVAFAAGSSASTFTVQAGANCGSVDVTASAPNHLPASAGTCVVLPPKITTFMPPGNLLACVSNSLTLTADCISAAVTATAIASDGTPTPLNVGSRPAQGTCVHGDTITLSVPALGPGSYRVEIADKGGKDTSTGTFTLAPNPRIMSAPAQITFQATCKPQTMTLSVSVAGADAVEFTYTSPDGTIAATVMRTGGGAPCATWSAAFAQAFDRKGTVTVVPLFGTTRGTSRTVTVDIASGSTAFSAVTFTGTTPPPGRPSATIERRDVPCDGSGPFVTTTVGTIASGGTATFTLTRGTLSMFTVTWPARETGGNDDVSGASTTTSEFLGHPDAPTLATDV